MLYGATSWVGVCCFIALTRTWGGTGAVLTANTRKLLSVALSFALFPKAREGSMNTFECHTLIL